MDKLELIKQKNFAELMGTIAVVGVEHNMPITVADLEKANQEYLDAGDTHGYPVSGDAITRAKAAN